GGDVDFGVPFIPLITVEVNTYEPEKCPLCNEGIPLTKPGSREIV
ncbi:MAG TPA: orotate phosphoribosyltransferase, partial [Flexistipes sinusarabici]|nr:orotate phosphoribosyltransferase [Flexistipes sinusarabici]